MVTDAVAKACYRARFSETRVSTWDALPEYAKDLWRSTATAAVVASRKEEAVAQPWLWPSKFKLHDRVRKIKGASWQGRVVGFYATHLTPVGYAVESEREPGSVQIYPEAALEFVAEDLP